MGYYRTRYTGESLRQLITAVKQQTLPPLDRLGLVDDMIAMVQAGQSSTVDALNLLEAYADEHSYPVLNRICGVLGKLSDLLEYTPHHNLLKGFVFNGPRKRNLI